MARNRLNQAGNAPVAQWIEQRFPKPRALVRFRPGALLDCPARSSQFAGILSFFLTRRRRTSSQAEMVKGAVRLSRDCRAKTSDGASSVDVDGAANGHRGQAQEVLRISGWRPLQLPADLPGKRLERARVQAHPEDLPDPRRSASVALGDADGRPPRHVARAGAHDRRARPPTSSSTGMKSGRVRTRSGDLYKPSAIRSYEAALRDHVVPRLGRTRLGDVQHRDVQRIADDLLAEGRDPSTIRNALMPLRVIFRRAVEDGDLAVNPCTHLRLPAVRGRRERIASPEEARAPPRGATRARSSRSGRPPSTRACAAASSWRSLGRRGPRERRHPRRAGVRREGARRDRAEEPSRSPERSRSSARSATPGRAQGRDQDATDGLVFGRRGDAVSTSNLWRRAQQAWKRAGLEPIGLHEARHTFASVLIAAGVNAKAITTYMGHASIQTTYDLYGKLMPGSESEATALVDAYLARARALRRDQQNIRIVL